MGDWNIERSNEKSILMCKRITFQLIFCHGIDRTEVYICYPMLWYNVETQSGLKIRWKNVECGVNVFEYRDCETIEWARNSEMKLYVMGR